MDAFCNNCKNNTPRNTECAKCYTDKKFNYEYKGHCYISEECKTCKHKSPIWCKSCDVKVVK